MHGSLVRSRAIALSLATLALVRAADAQSGTGSVRGEITDVAQSPIVGAMVVLRDTRVGARTAADGLYVLPRVPAGHYTLVVRRVGFAPDSVAVDVGAGATVVHDFALRPDAERLRAVTVTASPRLAGTKEEAIERQRSASNIVSVLSGDEIRSLPNANAAEAIARMPGISTERDEGEGKFVQIRGTEPRLSNVTIDGAHVPGTETGSRVPKLDAIPTDILGAIEVSKTLTADMDADAIGGSVNLVTKTPEGAPRGYVAGQFGQSGVLNRRQGQGSLSYGGRFGTDRKLGVLLGGTYDRNDRAINDLELAWSGDDAGRVTPVEWDQRDYVYDRTRYGAGGGIDYRMDDGSTMYVHGLWSKFDNFGTRYRYDVALDGDSAQAATGTSGIGTGANFLRESSRRTPQEQLWGGTAGGKQHAGAVQLDYAVDYAGTRQRVRDYRTSDFTYDGGGTTALAYDASSHDTPTYRYLTAADESRATTPGNYALSQYTRTDGLTTGRDVGGALDATMHYGATAINALKVGLKYRDETKAYVDNNSAYAPTRTISLAQALGGFTDPGYYANVSDAFRMGVQPDNGLAAAIENGSPSAFTSKTNAVRNALASFSGGEKVASAYAMNTIDVGALRVNAGLRAERTQVDYSGNVATKVGTATTLRAVPGTQTYTDLFPSAQLRLAVSEQTNVRLAVTRGIARANYSDLAPHVSGEVCAACATRYSNLSTGNPDLKAQHAWNYDLLGEHFISSTGVLSGGLFYKRITDFIYRRQFVYQGPATEFAGYFGTRPENGGDGHLAGLETDYTQRLGFLPAALTGLGVDVNYTYIDSRAKLLSDTAANGTAPGAPAVVRYAPLARQAKHIGNAALTYDRGPLSARAAWQYQGASIYAYGDGSATPSGDNWLFPHSQVDASVSVRLPGDASIQLQALNLNNAVFGFYNGTPGTHYANQREYYGRSFIAGLRYGFGGGSR